MTQKRQKPLQSLSSVPPLSRAMGRHGDGGGYDQPDVLGRLQQEADQGDADAAARLRMLESIDQSLGRK